LAGSTFTFYRALWLIMVIKYKKKEMATKSAPIGEKEAAATPI